MRLSLVALHTAATVVGMLAAVACGASSPTPAQQVTVGAFAAELLACVEQATTRAAADTCRRGVEARYADGGAR